MRTGFTVVVVTLFSGVCCAEQLSPDVLKGKQLAERHCSRCHVVDPNKPFSGISSTPSFKLLVNELSDWEERFISFYARLPHQSIVLLDGDLPDENIEALRPPVEIQLDDVDALVAYARTLIQ